MVDLETAVSDSLDVHKKEVLEYHSSDEDSGVVNFLVGDVLKRMEGSVDPSDAKDEIVRQLDNAVTDIEYPVQLKVGYRIGQDSIAEKLANKIREEVDVEIGEIDTPDRFHMPEVYAVYEIDENGNVDVIEQGVY